MIITKNNNGKYYRGNEEITELEYNNILELIKSKPIAPQGFEYRLTDSLEWELYELPIEETDGQATEQDYQNALAEMGGRLKWIRQL